MKLTDIIKGTEYELSLFSDKHIAELESRIVERKTNGGRLSENYSHVG